jgi:hypothetical protein
VIKLEAINRYDCPLLKDKLVQTLLVVVVYINVPSHLLAGLGDVVSETVEVVSGIIVVDTGFVKLYEKLFVALPLYGVLVNPLLNVKSNVIVTPGGSGGVIVIYDSSISPL